jgi:hypothetical protein
MSDLNDLLQAIDTAADDGEETIVATVALNQRQYGMLRHRLKPIHQADLVVSERIDLNLTVPCRSCRRLRSFDLVFEKQSQRIGACGSF